MCEENCGVGRLMAAKLSQAQHDNYSVLSELLTSMCHLIKLQTEVEAAEVHAHTHIFFVLHCLPFEPLGDGKI